MEATSQLESFSTSVQLIAENYRLFSYESILKSSTLNCVQSVRLWKCNSYSQVFVVTKQEPSVSSCGVHSAGTTKTRRAKNEQRTKEWHWRQLLPPLAPKWHFKLFTNLLIETVSNCVRVCLSRYFLATSRVCEFKNKSFCLLSITFQEMHLCSQFRLAILMGSHTMDPILNLSVSLQQCYFFVGVLATIQ